MSAFIMLMIIFLIFSASGADEFHTYSVADIYEGTVADDTCYSTISMYNDWIFAGQIVHKTEDAVNSTCTEFELTIYADYPSNLESLRIMARVIVDEREDQHTSIHNKTILILTVYDDVHLNESIEINENSTLKTTQSFVTSYEVLKIKFPSKLKRNWSLIFTAFHTGLCHSYEYMCANKRCIFHSLSCSEYDPCGDQSDCLISPAAYAAIALGGLCTLGVIIVIIYIIVKSRKASDWTSRDRQPRKFSPAKALQSVQAFTPATLNITPKRRWSYKY